MVYCDHQVVIFSLRWLSAYPSSVEVIVVWLSALSSYVEVIVVGFGFVPLSLLSSGDCYLTLCPSLLCRGD